MFNKFIALISNATIVTAVTTVSFCFSVTPTLAISVNVVRNCATFNEFNGARLRGTAPLGLTVLNKYYRSRNGIPMAVLKVWDRRQQRLGFVAVSRNCLESNRKGIVEYP
jgi:hypothetical protein